MEWKQLRAHYLRLFLEAKRQGESQETIAARAGFRQNVLSKMLKNDNLGPQVETFVKAIEGLGMPVSAFFLQIEGATKDGLLSPARPTLDEPGSPEARDDYSVSTPAAAAIFKRFLADLAASYPDAIARTTTDRPRPNPKPAKTARRKSVARVAGRVSRK